jgi:hypothetical protein
MVRDLGPGASLLLNVAGENHRPKPAGHSMRHERVGYPECDTAPAAFRERSQTRRNKVDCGSAVRKVSAQSTSQYIYIHVNPAMWEYVAAAGRLRLEQPWRTVQGWCMDISSGIYTDIDRQ